ncbi:MAG: Asp-tRNA(Asn)/Glu-tRNA(Gln) amidotransferase subunit GatA [Planctomycetota bacterium]|nr:Asp-tRNA(Asn)/Glu-tRNA(Gln) amidotransferase subunit GatA [Planctomycetota bacterium]MDW8373479.1 Asp-tRNA(Asn)/Glu-tRNA(Gln) amidotransferase subunit GatA [Planctomycetota bacterium]
MSPALAIAEAVNRGTSARAAVERALAACRAERWNCIVRTCEAEALAAAEAVDRRVRAGERLPLAGVPIAVKDNLCITGLPATCCSRMLAGYIAPYTATAIARLQDAGAVVVAQTNMDEFAFGSSNETSCYGPVRNPHDPTRIPGGSSGGSAAAVAAGLVPIAIGSDTGGSIRQPAGLCGCFGLKPTYGLVSRYGLIAFGSSLDQVGPLAADPADAEAALLAMAGPDPLDATSVAWELSAPAASLAGLRLGVVPAHREGLQPAVRAALEACCERARAAGAELVEVELPHERYAVAVYYIIGTGEAASNLARMDGVRFGHRAEADDLAALYAESRGQGFGAEAKRRIMLGTFVLSTGYYEAYYRKAMQVRRLIRDDFRAAFARCAAILGPVSPTTAFRFGEKLADPLQMYLSDIFTIAANLAGIPALSFPCGRDPDGLPIGLQLSGPPGSDRQLLAWSRALAISAGVPLAPCDAAA